MHYRLESFYDFDCRARAGRIASLSAPDDYQAVEQMRRACWQCECAGRSRILVLLRPSNDGWLEIARMGAWRYAGYV